MDVTAENSIETRRISAPGWIRVKMTTLAACLIASLLCAAPAAAHPVPFSYLDLRLGPQTLEGSLTMHMFDVGHDLDVAPPERLLEQGVAQARMNAIATLL